MNVELLRRVQAQMVAHPDHVDMNVWGEEWHTEWFRENGGVACQDCDAVACVSGTAAILYRLSRNEPLTYNDMLHGEKFLDISQRQAKMLFHTDTWPQVFAERLAGAEQGSAAYAQVVYDRIEHFLETNGTDGEISRAYNYEGESLPDEDYDDTELEEDEDDVEDD